MTPNTIRMDPAGAAPGNLPVTQRIEAPAAPSSLPSTRSVDPVGWADTAAAIRNERLHGIELPAWHDRMVGTRGD